NLIDNKNCSGAAGIGSIELEVDGSAPPTPDYTYSWFDGKLTSDPPLAGTDVITNLDGGFYTVSVTNTTTNNCTTTETFHLDNDPYIISIAQPDIALTPQSNCNPDNGDATVSDVLVDGASS